MREAKLASEPDILIGWFRGLGLAVTRIGLEAGPLSQWLYAGLRDAGLAVELLRPGTSGCGSQRFAVAGVSDACACSFSDLATALDCARDASDAEARDNRNVG